MANPTVSGADAVRALIADVLGDVALAAVDALMILSDLVLDADVVAAVTR